MATRRKARKKSKWLGRGTFGVGNCKNRRGSGNRGGRGMAGMCKHKATWATVYAPGYFGKHGFVRPNKVRMDVVHLFDIDRQALLGKLEKKEGKFVFVFDGKVLGTGKVTHPLKITALAWSKSVEEKLKAVGGEITNSSPAKPAKAPNKPAPAKAA